MIYTYEPCCDVPGWERVCSLADYLADPSFCCPGCGRTLKQTIPRVKVITSHFEAFKSPVDGTIITSRAVLEEHNRRNKVQNLHDGYDEKAILDFPNRNWHETPEKERLKDLNKDMEVAVQKLEDGYAPTPAEYTEEFPDA
jgi:hypothetical protein